MPNAAQIATYNFIRSEIARLRGPDSHVPVSLDQITALADEGDKAVFRVNGARVYIKSSGKVVDTGLPDCPTYASGLLPGRFLPAIAADQYAYAFMLSPSFLAGLRGEPTVP